MYNRDSHSGGGARLLRFTLAVHGKDGVPVDFTLTSGNPALNQECFTYGPKAATVRPVHYALCRAGLHFLDDRTYAVAAAPVYPYCSCVPLTVETCQKHLADAVRAERPRRLLEAIQQVGISSRRLYVEDGQRDARVEYSCKPGPASPTVRACPTHSSQCTFGLSVHALSYQLLVVGF